MERAGSAGNRHAVSFFCCSHRGLLLLPQSSGHESKNMWSELMRFPRCVAFETVEEARWPQFGSVMVRVWNGFRFRQFPVAEVFCDSSVLHSVQLCQKGTIPILVRLQKMGSVVPGLLSGSWKTVPTGPVSGSCAIFWKPFLALFSLFRHTCLSF